VCMWVKAPRGTGVCRTEVVGEAPSAALVVEDERVVPPSDVLALEEIPVEVLALARTVEVPAAPDAEVEVAGASAEVELAGAAAAADVVVRLAAVSAEVEDAGAATPAVEEGVNSALPALGAPPVPAPEEDPAVFEAVWVAVPLLSDDWI
jgi:hypothetical protein